MMGNSGMQVSFAANLCCIEVEQVTIRPILILEMEHERLILKKDALGTLFTLF
jgi:hypothetical protein